MIDLKLRQAGEPVNHKRVERLYTEAKLQVRRRRRKKIPLADRQPLVLGGHPKPAINRHLKTGNSLTAAETLTRAMGL